jgi:PAS domain S-box-containing protein
MNGPIRVLHVDDEADFADVTAVYLEREDDRLRVETATTPSEGLDRLAADDFDCVVSDYDMPRQTGIEFLESVRERHPDLPFILFTGKGSEAVASDAIAAGVTGYLQKQSASGQYELLANRITNAVAQYRAEQRAAETNQRLRELSDATDDILFMIDGDWSEPLFMNDAYERVFGRSLARLDEDPYDFLNAVHPDDSERVLTAVERVTGGQPVDIEYRLATDEDESRWVEVRAEPLVEDGEVARIAGFGRDITDRKERERELEATNRQLSTVVSNVPVILFMLDGEGVFTLSTGGGLAALGFEQGEVVGESLFDVYGEYDDIVTDGRRALAGDRVRSVYEVEGRYFDTTWDPVTDESTDATQVTAVIGVARDVTQRKERQRAIERRNERLEKVADAVSHDLRNPRAVAKTQLDRLREERGGGERVETIADAHDRMTALVSDLLTLTRHGEMVEDTEPVAVADLAADCWATLQTGDATLVVDTEHTVEADPDRLRRLFENLFRNAVEHGGPAVTVTVGNCEDGFYVADDGSGLPTDRERVFEAGYSTAEEGTGFGLSIVRQVAEAHGWTVSATDTEAGARFVVTDIGTDASN